MKKITIIIFAVLIFIVTNISAQEKEEVGVVINGIRWATRNVEAPGTFTANSEDAGMFYQWNSKTGWSSTDPIINSNGSTIWNSKLPTSTNWEKRNDPCPSGWRLPTTSEHQSLANTDSYWTIINGVEGRVFGNNNNTLFMPAAGYRDNIGGSLDDVGTNGLYRSSRIGGTNAYYLYFNSGSVNSYSNYNRAYGFSVRCVAE